MTIPANVRFTVRQRANFACEFCGVSEADTGGELTIDHFRPQTKGGTDDLDNLLYCCQRCNQYKAAYWPTQPDDPILWHPRHDPIETHFLRLADGRLHPITASGAFTLQRLRLNRPPLVAYRLRKQSEATEEHLLERYCNLVTVLEQLHQQQIALLEEQRSLLEEQRVLLQLLLKQQS
jgi:hypothetical protein